MVKKFKLKTNATKGKPSKKSLNEQERWDPILNYMIATGNTFISQAIKIQGNGIPF